RRPAPASAPRRRRPYWIALALVAVAAVVILTRMGADETTAQDSRADGARTPRAEVRPPEPERLRVRVVQRYPHDTAAFTQGLLWHDGFLYESTGLRGRSTLRRVRLESGEV